MQDTKPSNNSGGSAILRFVLFCILVGAAVGVLEVLFKIDDLKATLQHSPLYLSLACLAMIVIAMSLARFGGIGVGHAFEAGWKTQLLGVISFMWMMATAGAIARLINLWVPIETMNDGVAGLCAFLYFVIGLLILLPFQYIAFRPYAKRHNIPIWPNLPKE